MNNRIFYKNTLMLYLLRISNYLFGFITIPLQTRVLGPKIYALLAFSLSLSIYFQNFIDFGFTLSATEKISKNKNDKDSINVILSKVIYCRCILTIISMIIFIVIVVCVDEFRKNYILLCLYFFLAIILNFLPDYLYLGLEKMQYLTYKSVIARTIFTLLLFAFLKKKEYYYLVPVFSIIGNVIVLILIYHHIIRVLGYRIIKIDFKDIIKEFKWTFNFFFSRLASSIYSTINTMSIGFIFGSSSVELGLYKIADQSINVGKQIIIPITDSLFPHMANKKDFKLFNRILLIGSIFILLGIIIVNIFATDLCIVVFGNEFANSALYLRLLSPSVLFSFLTMMFGFPALSAIGKIKYANYSNVFSAIFQITILVIMLLTNKFTIVNLCILTCISEIVIFLFRFIVFIIYK